MFLRYSSEVMTFRIFDNKFQEQVFRTKLEAEYINDITFCENNIFVCFDNSVIARIYPNSDDYSDNENDEEEDPGYSADPMEQVE